MLQVSHPCCGRRNFASEADDKFMIHETLKWRKAEGFGLNGAMLQ